MWAASRGWDALGRPSWALGLGALISLALPAGSDAGEYHWGATLKCEECHVLTAEERAALGFSGMSTPTASPSLPLRRPGDDLCLECHDGRADIPDVLGENTGTHVRQAGALPTGAAPYQGFKGHELGVSAVPPGGMTAVTLHCTSCHAPHGTAYYRNLPSVTYAKDRNDLRKDVFLRSWARGQISINYSAENVDFNEPRASGSAMAEFCQGCHRNFHTVVAPGGAWLRHPTAAANLGVAPGGHSSLATFAGHPYRVKVLSQTGEWGPRGGPWPGAPFGLTPTCITCHRAHGNRNPFALIAPTGFTPISEEGDGKVPIALCRQCHAQGLPAMQAP